MKANVKLVKRSSLVALLILLSSLFGLLNVPPAIAAADYSGGYSHDSSIGSSKADWMSQCADKLNLSQLSIPGTHDTMALYGMEEPLEFLPEVKAISDAIESLPYLGGVWELFLDTYKSSLDVWSICQTLSLENQLEAGIRALDIRVRHVWEPAAGENQFLLYHGETYQKGDFEDVLSVCAKFLTQYPSETIIMRVKYEGDQCYTTPPHPNPPHGNPDTRFDDTFLEYLDLKTGLSEKETYLDYIWRDATWWNQPWANLADKKPKMPMLGDVRKKIVILQQFPEKTGWRCFGLRWDDDLYFDKRSFWGWVGIQDRYNLDDWYEWTTLRAIENVALKWQTVKRYLKKTALRKDDEKHLFFVNCLNGVNNICPPYMVASGHVFLDPRWLLPIIGPKFAPAPQTGGRHDGRYWHDIKGGAKWDLWEDGKGILSDYPLYYDLLGRPGFQLQGTNEMTYQYLAGNLGPDWPVPTEACGIILADFPGHKLIEQIISLNPLNRPPVAVASGPDVCDEGSQILFSSSGSSDPDGDTLEYQWDFGDGSTAPYASVFHAYGDNGVYTVTLTVTDGRGGVGADALTVTVNNVAPTAEAGADQTVNEGESVSFSGSFTDPGWLDTHTVEWTFGDGSAASGTLTPTHAYGDNGVFLVTLTVTDDDGDEGDDTLTVTVNNVAPTVTSVSMDQTNLHFILPNVHTLTFTGSFTDPGWLDTHTVEWTFGDGSIDAGTLTEENEEPDATGTTSAEHAYSEPGTYTVTLTITDDDGGTGTETWVVTVLTAEDAITVVKGYIQKCDDDEFKNNPDQKKTAFANKLDAVIKRLSEGAYQGAIHRLRDDVKAKVDGLLGCGPRHDWITDLGAQADLCMMIQDTIDYLETLL